MIAVATGQFIWHEVALSFLWMGIGGAGIGILIGIFFMKMHRLLPTDANIDIVLTVVTPFLMYLVAEELHASGVLAVVCGGLLLYNRSHSFLATSSRLGTLNVWSSLVFLLNGIVFMMIGLDLPQIVSGLETDLFTAFGYGVLITVILVITRIVAAYGAVFTTMIMRNFITVADRQNPGWKVPALIGWTGMRGVVSLAAALSIPLTLHDGTPFPHRNLILFITFVVILLTLLVQGLTLPFLITKFKIQDPDFTRSEKEIDNEIRNELAKIGVKRIQDTHFEKLEKFPAIKDQLQIWENRVNSSEVILNFPEYREVYLDIINHQREWLISKNREELLLDEEIVRKHLKMLDLQEEKLGMH